MTPPKQPPITEQKVSKDRLVLMLKNGTDYVEIVQDLIAKQELPYTVDLSDPLNPTLKDTLCAGELYLNKFITTDSDTVEMKRKAILASRNYHEVLIIGPTGTGKEIIAKSQISDKLGSVKAVNCAGFPETLIESELFGYVKGAFTGADSSREGLIAQAAGGVMFMDEVGELPLTMQAKLLRVIQERSVRRVGGTKDEEITCKFVFATNKDLEAMVQAGTFREDLFARISTLQLNIKSLTDRKCDIVPICKSLQGGEKFLAQYGSQLESGMLKVPYNVRSLQQYITRFNVWGCIN